MRYMWKYTFKKGIDVVAEVKMTHCDLEQVLLGVFGDWDSVEIKRIPA